MVLTVMSRMMTWFRIRHTFQTEELQSKQDTLEVTLYSKTKCNIEGLMVGDPRIFIELDQK